MRFFSSSWRTVILSAILGSSLLGYFETLEPWIHVSTLTGHTDYIFPAIFSSRDDIVATCSNDRTCRIWRTVDGRCIWTLKGHTEGVRCAKLSSDELLILTGSSDKTARLWDLRSGQCIGTFAGHQGEVLDVAFSCDESRVATCSTDGTVRLWNKESRECLSILKHACALKKLSISDNGQALVTVDVNGDAVVWALPSGSIRMVLKGGKHPYLNVALSQAGDLLVVVQAQEQESVAVWNLIAEKKKWAVPSSAPLLPAPRFLGERKLLVGWKILDADTGRIVESLPYPRYSSGWVVGSSDDGKFILVDKGESCRPKVFMARSRHVHLAAHYTAVGLVVVVSGLLMWSAYRDQKRWYASWWNARKTKMNRREVS